MKKKKFLKELKESMEGRVPKEILQGQLEYYDRYIEEELSKGYNEKEITARLGEPRLLAKTIIETQEHLYKEERYSGGGADGKINWNRILGIGIGVLIIILVVVVLFSILKIFLPVIFLCVFGVVIYRLLFQKS